MDGNFDIVVVGGGIVGLATAHRLLARRPGLRVALLEKEAALAAHQTGHNSGVVHSGLYYKPGSAKARTCVHGGTLLRRFCGEQDLPLVACGKVVVAVEERELPALEELHRRGVANGVPGLALVGPERLREIEPHATGIRALHVPEAAIVDYPAIARRMGELVEAAGGVVWTGAEVRAVREEAGGLVVESTKGALGAAGLIACAGLQSDRLARREGLAPDVRIIPFRGDYHKLRPEREALVRGLIYPVPDARFPFLGVHFTRMVRGGVEAGPNAVLALARERYARLALDPRDAAATIAWPGFWRLAAKHTRTGWDEVARSFSRRAFARALARLVPEVTADDIEPAGCGIRAQAIARDGSLVDDFAFAERPRAIHVLNAPSPAATASLAIADEIVTRAERLLPAATSVAAG